MSIREDVAAAANRLAAGGLVHGTNGNVSVRQRDRVAVSPTGAELATLEPEQVSVVDLDGRLLEGALEPTSELEMHLRVYSRFGAGAVVHTHAPVATALSCVVDEVPCVHYEMLALGGTVRVAPYATFGTPELASSALEALEGRTAALLASHGTLAYAADAASAVRLTELLEWACTVYWRARAIGEPRVLDEAEQAAVIEAALSRGYGSTKEASR